jgi:hypothetical protein
MIFRILTLAFLVSFISLSFFGQSHRINQCAKRHKSYSSDFQLKVTDEENNLRSDTINILKYNIDLDLTQIFSNELRGHCTIDFESQMDGINWLSLDLLDLTVDSVTVGEENLLFSYQSPLLVVQLPVTLAQFDFYSLTVHYHGDPETDATWGGFYNPISGYAFNLGVGFDADPHNFGRVWFPCFDNFVEKSAYEFHVLTNDGKTAYCNGLRTGVETVGTDSLLTHWFLQEEIPTYLASVAIGDYVHVEQEFTNLDGEITPVWLTAKSTDTLEMKQSMVNLIPTIEGFEDHYGLHRFPRVGYCAVPFNGGAMEHATNIAYPLFAIDGQLTYETLYAHELAHHWWGDNLTCRTAEDMWINEGWASYSEALFMEMIYGEEAYRNYVRDNHKDVLLFAHRDDGDRYPVSPVPHNLTYGSHVYNKGADMAHNLRAYMGDDFFPAIQALMEAFKYDDIDSEDMRDFLQGYTDADLTSFFDNHIFTPGFTEFRILNNQPPAEGATAWDVLIEQNQHYTGVDFSNVPLEITAFDANTNMTYDTTLIITQNPQWISLNLPNGFAANQIVLNPKDALSQAVLAESKELNELGPNDFDFAEMELDVEVIGQLPVELRIENHFAAADANPFIPFTDLYISPDRCWYVQGHYPEEIELSASIRYFGNESANSYFDPIFFTYLEDNGLTEDSLILMWRPDAQSSWIEYDNYELNIQGSEDNWTGRFDINNLLPGWYAWAVHTGVVSMESPFDVLDISCYFDRDGFLNVSGNNSLIEVFDVSGKLIYSGKESRIASQSWSKGVYVIKAGQEEIKITKED